MNFYSRLLAIPVILSQFLFFSSTRIDADVRHVRPSLHLPASISAASTGRISTKFDSGLFYENMSVNSNFG